ncbi:MAG: EAL domain-containing protein [Acidimicrobiales bacterium]
MVAETVARFVDVRVWAVTPDSLTETDVPAWVNRSAPGATSGAPPAVAPGDRFHLVACLEQAARRGRAEAEVQLDDDEAGLLVVALDLRPDHDALLVMAGSARPARAAVTVGVDPATGLLDQGGLGDRLRAVPDDRSATMFVARLEGLASVVRSAEEADHVVGAIAERLRDRMGDRGWLARLGVDTFALLVTDELSDGEGAQLAERLREALRQPTMLDTHEVELGAAIGWSQRSASPSGLLCDSELALHEAVGRGPAQTVEYDDRLRRRVTRRSHLRRDLGTALARDELFLDFQPVFDLHEMRPIGAEALMRWQHPVYGLLRPVDFIPLAEESGVIADLGWWLADQAVRALVAMSATYGESADFFVAMNVSGRQLNDERLVRDLDRVIMLHEIEPHRVTVELTETALLAGDQGVETLLRVADLGCRVAIDDFGAGFASLDYLSRLPVASVKLHPSFVQRIDEPRVTTLIMAILELCRKVGVEVFAEGIESTRQLKHLRDLGVGSGQGYVLGRPAALDSLIGEKAAAGVSRPRSGPAVLIP